MLRRSVLRTAVAVKAGAGAGAGVHTNIVRNVQTASARFAHAQPTTPTQSTPTRPPPTYTPKYTWFEHQLNNLYVERFAAAVTNASTRIPQLQSQIDSLKALPKLSQFQKKQLYDYEQEVSNLQSLYTADKLTDLQAYTKHVSQYPLEPKFKINGKASFFKLESRLATPLTYEQYQTIVNDLMKQYVAIEKDSLFDIEERTERLNELEVQWKILKSAYAEYEELQIARAEMKQEATDSKPGFLSRLFAAEEDSGFAKASYVSKPAENKPIRLTFRDMNGTDFPVIGMVGERLLDTAKRAYALRQISTKVPGACNGGGASAAVEYGDGPMCRTCHVYIDDTHLTALPQKSDEERYLSQSLKFRTRNSRFACEIVLTPELEGMTVVIPEYVKA